MTNAPMANDPYVPDPTPYQPPRRPVIVWFACGLLLLLSLLGGLFVALLFAEAQSDISHGRDVPPLFWIGLVVSAITVAAYIVFTIFIFRGASWARLAAIGLVAVNLLISLISGLASGATPNCVGLIPGLVLIALLLNRQVRDWCD